MHNRALIWPVYLTLLKCCSCLKSIAINTDISTSQYLEPGYKRKTCSSFSILVILKSVSILSIGGKALRPPLLLDRFSSSRDKNRNPSSVRFKLERPMTAPLAPVTARAALGPKRRCCNTHTHTHCALLLCTRDLIFSTQTRTKHEQTVKAEEQPNWTFQITQTPTHLKISNVESVNSRFMVCMRNKY